MTRNIHKIDATDKILGRLATEIAILLRGKHKVEYQPHMDQGDIVEVSNYDKIKVTGKKMDQKIYYKHSGYPGGLKETKLKKKMEDDPKFALRNAVYHMIPTNKLRDQMIKRLKFV
ncbi:50S ribosomal protein L13 [Candidatus Falkowbacteria bacterium]|jgi:large subunit ribosomal protein L13|nr:50S ribosomal protein L13 [Candidatus Falkowbacteria bacterium]